MEKKSNKPKKVETKQFWNYRLIRRDTVQGTHLCVTEVYWQQTGDEKPKILFTNDRPSVSGNNRKQVIEVLKRIEADIAGDIINFKDIPEEPLFDADEDSVELDEVEAEMERWELLIKQEPRLKKLAADIRKLSKGKLHKNFCANRTWVDEFKPRMEALVGWDAKNKDVATSEAYDTAYEHLYELLPPCGRCDCFQGKE